MKTTAASSGQKLLWACALVAACSMILPTAGAQSAASRIRSEIVNTDSAPLQNSLQPLAQSQYDAGRMPSDTRLTGITVMFNRTAAQEAALQTLIAAQQNPSSPLFHQWLTPEQFAARFGMADGDLAKVQGWLEQQGFSVDSVARSKNSIHFSGTARQVEQAFSTEMHYYKVNGVQHFAPSTVLSLPAAMASTVLSVGNLDSFRPMSHLVQNKNVARRFTGAGSTDSSNQIILFAPGDIATAYDIKPLYNSSVTGAGQSITIVGQSAIQVSDIEAFQNAAGVSPVKDPVTYLVPNSGNSTVVADGDESESDLDLEWSSAIAPGATINFVYTGSNQSYSAFDSIQYAVDEKIGTIISSSYGVCETALNVSETSALEAIMEQGTSQGQTITAAAGDSGTADCYGETSLSTANQEAASVDYPASSAYVTGMGGTEISQTNTAYYTVGNGYWESDSGSSDIVNSVQKYIPEVVWNDDSPNCGQSNCLSATGGGASALFTKPSWQTGPAGIPSSNHRYVPDLALYGSPNLPGYLFCTSDTTFWANIQEGSCTSGFEDSSSGYLTAAGGTSFDAPIFAGMLALINQKQGYTTGQGLVNPTLYSLASDSATYAAAFHDITSGNNDCTVPANCSSTAGFSAGTGYDAVTGLGSIDATVLATAWPVNTTGGTLVATTTTVSASSNAPNVGASDTFTVTVSAASGTPTGTVALTVDGGTPTNETLSSNGTFVYTTSFSTAGSHTILAAYVADTTYAASTGSVTVNVAAVSSGKGTIALSASPSTLSIAQGSSGNETITVTPGGGYTGTVDISFDTSNDNALGSLCYEFTPNMNQTTGDGEVPITGTTAQTTTLNLDANAADCATAEAIAASGKKPFKSLHSNGALKTASNSGKPGPLPMTIAFAGLLLVGFLGRGSRKLRGMAGLLLLATVGLALSACGGVVNSNGLSNPSAGTYTVTVTGTDEATSSITGTTTFTFVITP
jgi:subtilase family serine protease